MSKLKSVAVDGNVIRQDKQGRYSLNDLHKAAMVAGVATESHAPSKFLRNDKVQDFIKAIEDQNNTPIVSKRGGIDIGGGTWAIKIIFLKYSSWLSVCLENKILNNLIDVETIIKALDSFEVPDELEDMFVYAIRNTTTGNIKLGISKNPKRRLEQLQVGNDCKLELVAYKRAENKFKDEVYLHNKFSAYRIHGEWFSKEADCAIA